MAGTSDLDRQIEQLRRCEYIKEAEVKALCAKAREILVEESNVQRVDAPVTVTPRARPRVLAAVGAGGEAAGRIHGPKCLTPAGCLSASRPGVATAAVLAAAHA